MPKGAVYVGRPTKWGTPYKIGDQAPLIGGVMDAEDVVERYCDRITSGRAKVTEDDIRRELRGKDLVCWCRLDQPCHADILLEIANMPEST